MPEPTSPCSSRRMGTSRRRSPSSSSSACELVRGELERQAVEERAADVARLRQRRRVHALLLLLLVQQQPGLHEQQLLEHQALAGRAAPPPSVRGRCTAVTASARPGRRSRTSSSAGSGSGSRRMTGATACTRRAQELGRHLLAGRVHGDDALGVHALPVFLVEDLVPLDHERLAASLRPERPAQAQPHALLQDLGEIALVEPHRLDRAGVVAQQDLDDVDSPAGGALGAHAHDLAADGGLLPHLEVADALAVAEVLVAAREVLDEVADGVAGRTSARRRATAAVTCSSSASGRASEAGSKERRVTGGRWSYRPPPKRCGRGCPVTPRSWRTRPCPGRCACRRRPRRGPGRCSGRWAGCARSSRG